MSLPIHESSLSKAVPLMDTPETALEAVVEI